MTHCKPWRHIGWLTAVLLVSSNVPATAADWSRFRGPGGAAASTDRNVPLAWSETENVIWKTRLPGHGSSSPVIHEDRIFLTAYSGYGLDPDAPGKREDLRLHVLCFDRSSGKLLWDRSRPAGPDEQKVTRRVADHGYATPTPTCDSTGVYAFFGTSGAVAYDLDGNLKWTAGVGSKTAGFGSAASPILYKDLVIVNASIESDTLLAYNKDTGSEIWRAEGILRSWSTPTIADVPGGPPELIMNQKNTIYGIDPDTGERLWSCEGIQDYIVPCVIAHEGIAYCIGGRANRAIAVRLGGRGDVTDSHKLWEVNVGANVTSPVYSDGHLYWASDKAIAFCLEAKTGEVVYRERLPTRARIYASVVLVGDRLYCTTRDRGVVVLQAGPKFEELARNVLGDDENMFNATPAISNGQILLRTNQYMYCLGTE